MNRPSKKEIKAALDRMKQNEGTTGPQSAPDVSAPTPGSLSSKKANQRIRKKGV